MSQCNAVCSGEGCPCEVKERAQQIDSGTYRSLLQELLFDLWRDEVLRFMREWLRENLVLDVETCDKFGAGNDVYVGLRFKGEDKMFSREHVYIPG